MESHDRLKVGDVVTVHHPLLRPEDSKYPVTRIDGKKAVTAFRDFNTRIHHHKFVYEYGKKLSTIYNNTYTVNDPPVAPSENEVKEP